MFVDKVQVQVQAGNGGNGVVSFRREKFIDRGGPDGGDGGKGGDVIMVASRNQNTLAAFRYQKSLVAQSGKSGFKQRKKGKSGEDLVVPVPVGTVVNTENGEVIVDLTKDGQRAIVARGGDGGFGNAHFVSSTRQAPKVAEKGEKGQKITVVLELKMIADVGLVGLPNAGKSTLLATISNAQPEIADYPFTTLTPNLGVVDVDQNNTFLFADIPGLIEGASQGKGLGDEFLRHVERTNVLVHLIDIYQNNISAAYQTIQKELADYRVDLSGRPQIVVLNKVDGLDEDIIADKMRELKKNVPKNVSILAISAASGQGVKELLYAVKDLMIATREKAAKATKKKRSLPVIRFIDQGASWQVQRFEGEFLVTGHKIERFAKRTDFANEHGVQRLRDIMQKMGILQELLKQGISPGEKIIIGKDHIGEIEY